MASDVYSSPVTTMYRIGDFAKYLGVTPDFLKHYESLGIIHSEKGENGYRYYRFQESNRIFECIKLKNLGFTIRESQQIISDLDEAEIMRRIGENVGRIRRDIQFKQALLSTYGQFEEEMRFLDRSDSDWSIRNTEPLLFLPHTRSRDFIGDPGIYEILPDWMSILPLARSAALIPPERPADDSLPSWTVQRTWGFVAPKSLIESLEIPTNAAVIELPAGKALHYLFSARRVHENDRPENYYAVWRKLGALNLKPKGNILAVNNMAAHENGKFGVNQHYIVPIE